MENRDNSGESEPPQESTGEDAEQSEADLKDGGLGIDEVELCVDRDKEEEEERVGDGKSKCGEIVLNVGAASRLSCVEGSGRIGTVEVDTEGDDDDLSDNTYHEMVLVDDLPDEAERENGEDRIEEVGGCGTESGSQSVSSSPVEGALYTEDCYRSDGNRYQDTKKKTLKERQPFHLMYDHFIQESHDVVFVLRRKPSDFRIGIEPCQLTFRIAPCILLDARDGIVERPFTRKVKEQFFISDRIERIELAVRIESASLVFQSLVHHPVDASVDTVIKYFPWQI